MLLKNVLVGALVAGSLTFAAWFVGSSAVSPSAASIPKLESTPAASPPEIVSPLYPKGLDPEEREALLLRKASFISLASPEEEKRPLYVRHKVQSGETLWDLAGRYHTDVASIAASNEIPEWAILQIGEELLIPTRLGILHKVQEGDSLSELAELYDIDAEEIARVNRLESPARLQPGELLLLPGARPRRNGRPGSGSTARVASAGSSRFFRLPIGGRITSYFGPRWGRNHEGLDIAAGVGDPVVAARPGKVVFAGWKGDYGYTVMLDHSDGFLTLYAHNSRLTVSAGQWVAQGETIARAGSTGRSTGPHVHFEIRRNGVPVNPLDYVR